VIKLKNVRPGILIIADAGLKLAPGETIELEKLTKQAEKAVDEGLLARVDSSSDAKPEAKPKPKTSAKPAEGKADSKKATAPQKQEEQPPASNGDSKNGQSVETGQGQLIGAGSGSN